MHILTYGDEDLSVSAGGARQVLELTAALAQRGHAVTLVAPEPMAPCRGLTGAVDAHWVPVMRRGLLRPLSFLLRSGRMLRRLMEGRRPDVLLWFDSPGQVAPLWALKDERCPLVYFVNGLPAEEVTGIWKIRPIRTLLTAGLHRGVARAQAVVSVCPELLEQLPPVAGQRRAVIRNGVAPDRFIPFPQAEARATLGLQGPGPSIGFVGGFFPWHGLETLVDAMSEVIGRYPGAQLLLVGEGQTKTALEQQVRDRGLARHVTFVGRAAFELVPLWIAACDVCVVLHKPTRSYPGDSMKLWEYLACGRPVVTTAGPGYGDLVESLGCGLSAAAGDPRDVARQLLRLLNDPSLRARMGAQARRAILGDHTWAARAGELERVCQDAIEQDRPLAAETTLVRAA